MGNRKRRKTHTKRREVDARRRDNEFMNSFLSFSRGQCRFAVGVLQARNPEVGAQQSMRGAHRRSRAHRNWARRWVRSPERTWHKCRHHRRPFSTLQAQPSDILASTRLRDARRRFVTWVRQRRSSQLVQLNAPLQVKPLSPRFPFRVTNFRADKGKHT